MFKKENIYYLILFLIGIYVGINKYGVSSTFQIIAVLYCILQAVGNLTILYKITMLKLSDKPLPYNRNDIFFLLATWVIVLILYFIVLTVYFQSLVLYLVSFIVLLLFIVNYLKSVLRR